MSRQQVKREIMPGYLYSRKFICEEWDIAPGTFYKHFIDTGILPQVKLSERCVRYRGEDLLAATKQV